MKHPKIVERALREHINELQFRIETEANAPDIDKVKEELHMAEESLAELAIPSIAITADEITALAYMLEFEKKGAHCRTAIMMRLGHSYNDAFRDDILDKGEALIDGLIQKVSATQDVGRT